MNPPLPYNWLNRAWIGFYGQKYDFDSLSSLSWAFMCHSCDCRTEMTALQLNALLSALLKGVKVGTWSLSSHLPPGPQHHRGLLHPCESGLRGSDQTSQEHVAPDERKAKPCCEVILKKKKLKALSFFKPLTSCLLPCYTLIGMFWWLLNLLHVLREKTECREHRANWSRQIRTRQLHYHGKIIPILSSRHSFRTVWCFTTISNEKRALQDVTYSM